MTGYSPTHIPIPKNHADFERKATVLFREILKDPDAHRLGREGQVQWGIDIVGYDGGNTSRIVGNQCKKKAPNQVLTAKEMRGEVRKAQKYKPAIYKYIIITTAPKDRRLEQLAHGHLPEREVMTGIGPVVVRQPRVTGEEIKALREKAKLSQAVFADCLNVTVGYVSQLERGAKRPSGPTLVLLNVIHRKGIEAIL